MSLRTRIAVTFLLLLTVVLAAALGAVSIANRTNAERDVQHQLQNGTDTLQRLLNNNRRLLTQAARAVADDYAFREALAGHDTETQVSALANQGDRVGAAMVVLTSLDGHVIATSGSNAAAGTLFPIEALRHDSTQSNAASVIVDGGRVYQLVAVAVRSPLPVAYIAMGFELDHDAARELANATGLRVRLSIKSDGAWRDVLSIGPDNASTATDLVSKRIELNSLDRTQVAATLSRSLSEALAPFERLTDVLFLIAGASLIAFIVAAFWIARNITQPLQELTQSVDRIRDGTYDVRLDMQRQDELGVLAEGLQLMQSAVMSRDQSIRRLAYEDGLTGLMNRTAFGSSLQQVLDTTRQGTIGVAVINLNRFRRINEHLGYSVGDAVLRDMAARLSDVASVHSCVARLAADQFAAYARLPDSITLQAWGTSLLKALADPVIVENQPIDISASIGLAAVGVEASPAHELLRWAELALERARREKRPLALYEAALKSESRDQLSLLGELRHAVEHDELRLVFQPKIELATGRIAGAEVLLRWQHPTRGLLSPAAFIPFAEQTGFIRWMTRWTLDRAIARGAEWYRAGEPLALAVNISAADLGDLRLDARVAALLTRHQLPPALLTLELTESGFIEDPERALQMLNSLAALGVNLSIDDFGTGYSSLSHLARMPVHEVKIDRSFIQGMESESEYAAVVRSAIEMGHSLGLKVVAEGIETASSAERLREFGCDIVQGFLYAKPMACEHLQAWLAGKTRVPVIAVPMNFSVDDVAETISLMTY